MGDTIWIKHLKDGFTPNPTQPGDTGDGADGGGVTGSGVGVAGAGEDGVPGTGGDGDPVDGGGYGSYFSKISNFGENPYIGEDSNELILKGKKPPIPKTTTAPSETTPPIETKPPVTNANKANAAYSNYSDNTKNIISKLVNIPVYIATKMVKALYDNMDSSNVQNDVDIIADQISLWIKYLVVSYIFVINWWYIRCYTDYEFNFKDILTFDIIYWSSVGPASAIQVLNYPLLGFRYNKDMLNSEEPENTNTMNSSILPISGLPTATSTTKEAKNNKFSDKQMMKYIKSVHDVLWGWRPIAFSLFHLIIFLIMMSFSVSTAIESNMTDNSTFFMIICILSIYYFITLFIKEQWYLKFMNGIVGYLLLVALLIGALIVMYLFNRIVCPIFTVYFLVLSYFAILIFQGLGVIKKLTEFYTDLEPEPIPDTETGKKPDSSEKIFQYFHRIYFILMVIAIVIFNCYNSMSISFEPLLILTIVLNVLMFILFGSIVGNHIIYNIKEPGQNKVESTPVNVNPIDVAPDAYLSHKPITTDNQHSTSANNTLGRTPDSL